jgi:hypothetical protein
MWSGHVSLFLFCLSLPFLCELRIRRRGKPFKLQPATAPDPCAWCWRPRRRGPGGVARPGERHVHADTGIEDREGGAGPKQCPVVAVFRVLAQPSWNRGSSFAG